MGTNHKLLYYLGILTFLVPCKSKVTQDELFDDPWSVPRTNCSDSSSLIISVKPISKLAIFFLVIEYSPQKFVK